MQSSGDPHHTGQEEARRVLQAGVAPGWHDLIAPLTQPDLDALVEQAIERRARVESSSRPLPLLRRRPWILPLAACGALAAGFALVIRIESQAADPFELHMRPGQAGERGEARADEQLVYSPRNEPLWTVHASERMNADELQLDLVAQTDAGLELLRPRVEQRGKAFRVLGEIGDLALRPGEVTVHFILRPRAAQADVVATLDAHLAGSAMPPGWQTQSRQLRIVD